MKSKFALSLLCLGLFLFSCKKSANNIPAPLSQQEVISFKMNGNSALLDTTAAVVGQNTLQVKGNGNSHYFAATDESLYIAVAGKVGTSVVGDNGVSASINLMFPGLLDQYKATKGTITVTSISTKSVSGTFEFVAADGAGGTINVTDGQFTLNVSQ